MPTLDDIAADGATAAEQFATDNSEIDRTWKDGRLDEWIEEKLADERREAGFDPNLA